MKQIRTSTIPESRKIRIGAFDYAQIRAYFNDDRMDLLCSGEISYVYRTCFPNSNRAETKSPHPCRSYNMCVCYAHRARGKWREKYQEREGFFPLCETEFEGVAYPILSKVDNYLKHMFGNYMSLPSSIHTHELSRISLLS